MGEQDKLVRTSSAVLFSGLVEDMEQRCFQRWCWLSGSVLLESSTNWHSRKYLYWSRFHGETELIE